MTHHEGRVTVYEPSPMLPVLERTLRVNDVAGLTTVEHAAVGGVSASSERIFGTPAPDDVDAVAPADLPACDVLDVDCEGAELEVLRGIDVRPRVLVVEAHPHLGCSCAAVAEDLDVMGYEMVDREPADAPDEITNFVTRRGDTQR
jgi:hypothetical protein